MNHISNIVQNQKKQNDLKLPIFATHASKIKNIGTVMLPANFMRNQFTAIDLLRRTGRKIYVIIQVSYLSCCMIFTIFLMKGGKGETECLFCIFK